MADIYIYVIIKVLLSLCLTLLHPLDLKNRQVDLVKAVCGQGNIPNIHIDSQPFLYEYVFTDETSVYQACKKYGPFASYFNR
jgi:hypothetical protein